MDNVWLSQGFDEYVSSSDFNFPCVLKPFCLSNLYSFSAFYKVKLSSSLCFSVAIIVHICIHNFRFVLLFCIHEHAPKIAF